MTRVLVIGDVHEPASHPAYLSFCQHLAEKWDTQRVVFIGDIPPHRFTPGEMPSHVEAWLKRHTHTSSSQKKPRERKKMLEMLTDVQGIIIAGAILWAGKEIHNAGIQIQRVSNAIESLDRRVSDLERVFSAERVRESERRDSINNRHEESGSNRES